MRTETQTCSFVHDFAQNPRRDPAAPNRSLLIPLALAESIKAEQEESQKESSYRDSPPPRSRTEGNFGTSSQGNPPALMFSFNPFRRKDRAVPVFKPAAVLEAEKALGKSLEKAAGLKVLIESIKRHNGFRTVPGPKAVAQVRALMCAFENLAEPIGLLAE